MPSAEIDRGAPPASPAPAIPQRLMSVDALRGFTMFWIIIGDAFFQALDKMFPTGPLTLIATQLDHVAWEGVRFYDLIFPTFVFVIGVSIVFSVNKMIATEGRPAAIKRILRRGALLYLIGIVYYLQFSIDGYSVHLERIRLLGVLQRLAICYTCAALLFCWLRPRALLAVCIGILLGYWALLALVPVPGVGAGNYAEGKNLTNYIDKEYLPGFKWDGDHDPEGLLSTLPAIASCLLGVFTGLILRCEKSTGTEKAGLIATSGLGLLLLGFLWGNWFPVIKKIWTSSYVLVAGGYSALFLAAFYWLVDVRQWRCWAQPFVWIGMNAITIYLLDHFFDFESSIERLSGFPLKTAINNATFAGFGNFVALLISFGFLISLAWFLHRKRWFLRL